MKCPRCKCEMEPQISADGERYEECTNCGLECAVETYNKKEHDEMLAEEILFDLWRDTWGEEEEEEEEEA